MNYIQKSLSLLYECIKQEDTAAFVKQVELIAGYLGYDTKEEHCKKTYETICDPKFHPAFNMDQLKRIAITFHSSKGLEFEQVVLFVSDYRLASEEDVYNHYVASTRAKTKLILVYINGDYNASQFAQNINNILGKSGLKMKDIATVINCLDCLNN